MALQREKMELTFGPDNHLLAVRISVDGKIVQTMRGRETD
jgi:hypothetical protein